MIKLKEIRKMHKMTQVDVAKHLNISQSAYNYYENGISDLNTDALLKFIVDNNIKTILGGGDIVAAATNAGYKDKVYHASTGGGATLEYLEGKTLPGVEAIK